jgi:hypothetical protein
MSSSPDDRRHFVISCSPQQFSCRCCRALSLALPSWDIRLPDWSQRDANASWPVATVSRRDNRRDAVDVTGIDLETIVVSVWSAGFALTALLLLVEGWRLVRISGRAEQIRRTAMDLAR